MRRLLGLLAALALFPTVAAAQVLGPVSNPPKAVVISLANLVTAETVRVVAEIEAVNAAAPTTMVAAPVLET